MASGTPRNGTDGTFVSPVVGSGARYAYTFDTVGSFDYFCTLHPWMTGAITVSEDSGDAGTAPKDVLTGERSSGSAVIPDWVRLNAQWWSDGMIGDDTFVGAIQWMISNNVIAI